MSRAVIVLDACTLYPAALRDVLMRLAVHGPAELMRAYQAEMIGILREARLSLKHPPLDAAEYLEILRVQGLARTCGALGRFLDKL